ncbi:hypothetical protein GCM10010496_31460 [Streptomyces asoensis]|nr:hypothetical protein GCM10010496_31460 [Streptomyces asoensis]
MRCSCWTLAHRSRSVNSASGPVGAPGSMGPSGGDWPGAGVRAAAGPVGLRSVGPEVPWSAGCDAAAPAGEHGRATSASIAANAACAGGEDPAPTSAAAFPREPPREPSVPGPPSPQPQSASAARARAAVAGRAHSALWTFTSTGTGFNAPVRVWDSDTGSWTWDRTKTT